MSEPRIQLWTDDSSSQFAIFLNSKYVIRTDEKAKYSKLIDESVCLQGYDYDWKHTLSQWVMYLFGNKLSLPDKPQISSFQQSIVESDKNKKKSKHFHIPRPHNLPKNSNKISKTQSQAKSKSKQAVIKCNSCNLKFCIEEERDEHERFWHSRELTTS
ncbi:MAG TPA: hypothetical protein VH415_09470 [Nitrososphaeraceae archaeon]|jgi:hypothetical protein